MKVGLYWASAEFALVSGSLLVGAVSPALAQRAGDPIPNSYICVFKPGPINAGIEARMMLPEVSGRLTHVYATAIRGFSAFMPEAAMLKLMKKNPLLEYCEQDRIATIPVPDVAGAAQPGGRPGGGDKQQETSWGVTRVGGPGDGRGKTAWVLDSGIDLDHPDLNVDVPRSKSFLSGDPSPDDANGHGTHVAGIIGAIDNGYGVVGVAAGASVVSLRVLDRRGSGPDSGVIAAIDHAAAIGNPGDVVNLSLITSAMKAMDDAVLGAAKEGLLISIAAGNSADDAEKYSPARANGTNVYTVSAFESGDKWAYYSNFGNPPIDFSEPGSSIKSTYKGGGYTTKSGTSMAAPHLAGILLLTGGQPVQDGTVTGDPDGQADAIGVKQ